ncbi:MAG: hypothetical protein D6706_12440 [Chloroflexi bacterium]|nr:MAG: hypothetical protein D6706_12440 [Chloroflexota bacterium]
MGTFSDELRADSSALIIPVMTVLMMIAAMLAIANADQFITVWPYGVMLVGAPIVGRVSWWLIRRERPNLGGAIFVGGGMVLVTLLIANGWHPNTSLPYVLGVFVVISGMIGPPHASLVTWVVATVLLVTAVFSRTPLNLHTLIILFSPIGINFILALAGYLSAVEWQVAVDSISELHRRAQRRRDELFAIQEELRLANARLQSLNQQLEQARQIAINERDMRTRFMNNVSHELRTPLNAIVNFAHILGQGGRGPVNEAQLDYLTRIEKSGWHLLNVLNDLLDMAQIQAGEFKLALEVTDLQAICEEVMTSTRGLILDKDVELIRDYPDTWPLVRVDKMRIRQALLNLLGNAAKYTDEGYIALRVRSDDQYVSLTVEDTGIGIPPAYHEVIFQEFRQVDDTAARRRVGTGLGLPITRHLVERHGGSIRLESAPGEGSRFTITLPVYVPDQETAVSPETPQASRN